MTGRARLPPDRPEQLAAADPACPGEPHERLQQRLALPHLKQTDLRAVDAGTVGKRLLGDMVVVEPRHQQALPERLTELAHECHVGSRECA